MRGKRLLNIRKLKSPILKLGLSLTLAMLYTAVYSQERSGGLRESVRKSRERSQRENFRIKNVGQSRQMSLEVGGLRRTCRLYVPSSYRRNKPAPLVLVFHGGGGTGAYMERVGFNPLADRKGFLVVYPDGIDGHWNDGRNAGRFGRGKEVDDVGFVSALIDHLSKSYAIDSRRIYATGASNGGIFSHRLGGELSDKIAAIAPVIGSMPEPFADRFAPRQPVSVVMFNGTEDRAVRMEGGAVLGREGGRVRSVADTVALWVKANGCPATPKRELLPDQDPNDGTRVRRASYSPGKQGSEVVLYLIVGGGHNWPGVPKARQSRLTGNTTHDINATEMIWDFFEKHPKP